MSKKTVCFTGHRAKALCNYEKAKYEKFVDQLKKLVAELIDNEHVVRFITGGAQGMDQLAFWAVNAVVSGKYDGRPRTGIENVVYEPFENYGSNWAKTGLFSQSQYALMKRYATNVETLHAEPANKNEAVKLLTERNHAMVDDSDIVVGLINGYGWTAGIDQSGTAECMRYAKETDSSIIQICYERTVNEGLRMTSVTDDDEIVWDEYFGRR